MPVKPSGNLDIPPEEVWLGGLWADMRPTTQVKQQALTFSVNHTSAIVFKDAADAALAIKLFKLHRYLHIDRFGTRKLICRIFNVDKPDFANQFKYLHTSTRKILHNITIEPTSYRLPDGFTTGVNLLTFKQYRNANPAVYTLSRDATPRSMRQKLIDLQSDKMTFTS